MLILGKTLKQHEIVDLDVTRFIDTIRFDPFEPGATTFTVHTVKVDFGSNEVDRELLCGGEGIMTEHLSSDEIITSAELLKTFSKLGLDSEAWLANNPSHKTQTPPRFISSLGQATWPISNFTSQ